MSSVNKAILLGNLGQDPEVRNLPNGGKVVNLSIATGEQWKDKNTGEKKERTEWHRVVIFQDGIASVAEQYLRKGSKVYVEGQIQTRKWQDQSGQDKYSTEIVLQGFNAKLVLLDGQGGGGNRPPPANSPDDYGSSRSSSSGGGSGASAAMDDDIPFEMSWR